MTEMILDPYDSQHLYEYSFDEMIAEFQPLRNKEEKKYIKIRKYPIIFKLLPMAMKNEYSSLSISGIQIYATRLGLAKLSHDTRIKELINISMGSVGNANKTNLNLCYFAMQRMNHIYVTPNDSKSPINISTTEEVKSFVAENGDYIGLPDSQLGVFLFLKGVEDAAMNESYHIYVQAELTAFWRAIERRIFVLNNYAFKNVVNTTF